MQRYLRKIYYFFRPYIPIRYRWKIQEIFANRKNGMHTEPMWPIPENPMFDPDFNQYLQENGSLPFVLTHDVDTQHGFDNILAVAEVEQQLGLRSSWNIVPNLYKINYKTIDALKEMGMEIGVHDWNHDGKLFSNRKVFLERTVFVNDIISSWRVKGFRAGMAFHNDSWMQDIACQYDSSYYDTDPYQPLGGGCSYLTPFSLGRIIEIPYTMPQDHVLFVAKAKVRIPLAEKPISSCKENVLSWMRDYLNSNNLLSEKTRGSYIVLRGVDIWKMKMTWLVENKGIIVMITHPDYLCNDMLKTTCSDGFFDDEEENIQYVRKKNICKPEWRNSLLEQYAAFLKWAATNFPNRMVNCLPEELSAKFIAHTTT